MVIIILFFIVFLSDGTGSRAYTISGSNGSIWTSGNDGAGSGLDADTLDGAQPSASAGNNTIVKRHSSGYIYANYFNTTPNDVTSGVTRICCETGNDGFIRHATQAAVRAFIGAGSGNGLDADTVDTLHASSFLRSDANDTATGALTIGNAVYSNYTSADTDITGLVAGSTFGSLIESSANAHLVVGVRDNDAADSFSVVSGSGNYMTDSTYDKLVFQARADGVLTANGGNTIWHAGNDGSGSGLDADTLDGVNSGSFLRSDAGDTFDGSVSGRYLQYLCVAGRTFNSTSGNLSPLEIKQNTANADAAMTFHIGGDYAAYFGLDGTTNDLFLGGWSKGAAKYKIWHAANDGLVLALMLILLMVFRVLL